MVCVVIAHARTGKTAFRGGVAVNAPLRDFAPTDVETCHERVGNEYWGVDCRFVPFSDISCDLLNF
jgi:hypothetical protein